MASGRTGDAYQPILDALAEVRDARDPLFWDALVEEADLLIEKQRFTDGVTAAWEALELNPRLAIVWYRLGRLSARTFDFEGAQDAADMLRALDGQHHLANLVEAEQPSRRPSPSELSETSSSEKPVLVPCFHEAQESLEKLRKLEE